MLSREDNELLCRVGPGTPMGEFMRHYWIPAARSAELPAASRAPLRVRLLGENLIAFRVATGAVSLIADSCPHRGASLFYGRNEGDGLRCVYHGWKFDVTGACMDMPSEPPECDFRQKVRATTYPCVERGGVIWTYMGPRETAPPLPELEGNMDPASQVSTVQRACNYLQALEGDIDTVHFAFLHTGHMTMEDAFEENFLQHQFKHRAPRYDVKDTEYGTCYGAYRPTADDNGYYWRIANFLFPFYTQVPGGALAIKRAVRAWVPMDDEHTMAFTMQAPSLGGGLDPERLKTGGRGFGTMEMLPDTTDWYGRSRPKADASNDYLLDRDAVARGESYTGLPGLVVEDQAVTESMGTVYDRSTEHLGRSTEHLGTSDVMIIRSRLRLLRAAQALRANGGIPPGVDDPAVFAQRSGGIILPRDVNWFEATKELRKAFVKHSEALVRETIGVRAGASRA
jgi:phthalate 4,5-dioxygenase